MSLKLHRKVSRNKFREEARKLFIKNPQIKAAEISKTLGCSKTNSYDHLDFLKDELSHLQEGMKLLGYPLTASIQDISMVSGIKIEIIEMYFKKLKREAVLNWQKT